MSVLGTRVLRREDPALLRGAGRFVADLPELADAAVLTYVRSTVAHARIVEVDIQGALDQPGVIAVFTAADLDLAPPSPRLPWVPAEMARPWLAVDRVRFVGEPVAVVVAETAAAGVDAAEAVIVEYEPLEVVVDPDAALAADAPRLFEAGNLACEFLPEDVDPHLFDGCEVVVEARLVNQRMAAAPLEGRAAGARWESGRCTLWISSQAVHGVAGAAARALGVERSQVRVIAPDVGGGFGAKIAPYPEELLVPWIARRIGRPVRWVEDRTENMLSLGHGRDQIHRITIGGTRTGRVEAYRLEVIANAGAYPAMAAFLPTFTRLMAPGTYDIGRVETVARTVVTNTMSIEAFRGAGRPEATAAIERAMDLFAAEVGLDPAEVRRLNLLASHDTPIATATGATYDAGDYRGALDAVLAAAGYEALRAEQAERRRRGDPMLLGIGVSCYVEITAGGGAPTEFGSVEVDGEGVVTVRTGSSPHGQGLHTALASLVADELGVAPESVVVIHGDTAEVPKGGGTMGSRSLQLGGSAAVVASRELVERARDLAAQRLEAAVADITFEAGRFSVAGTPSVSIGWAELVADEPLRVDTDFQADGPTFPFGAHVAVVEVDAETGRVRILRHVACDDAGVIVNPLLAEGQRHGGIAQGIAQALLEEVRYDVEGNPLTTNFADYGVISAAELPRFELVDHATPTPYNPLGAKGIGESGTIGATPAVQSAVIDALAHLGVRHLDMPFTSERVWRAIQDAG